MAVAFTAAADARAVTGTAVCFHRAAADFDVAAVAVAAAADACA